MVYKIRIILDAKDNIFRDVEIKENQTLWNLHLGIKSAFSLQGEDLSLFNILDEEGVVVKSVPLEDMSDEGDGEIMSDVYINEAFENIGDKLHFQYGFMDLWEFFCELVEEYEEKTAVNYPITVFRFGNMPLKAPNRSNSVKDSKNSAIPLMDEDFDNFDEVFETEENFADQEDETYNDQEDDYNEDFFEDDDSEEV